MSYPVAIVEQRRIHVANEPVGRAPDLIAGDSRGRTITIQSVLAVLSTWKNENSFLFVGRSSRIRCGSSSR